MGIAYDYLTRRHSAAYADAIELDRVRTDIKRMEDQLEKVTNELEGARVYAGVLTSSIATAQQLVEDECKRNDWPLPEAPAEPPAPAPIADRITRETTGTLAFEAVIPCRHCGAPIHKLHTQVPDDPFWVHVHQDFVACDLVVPIAGSTHAEPAEPAATTRTDDPLRFQRLDQDVVREAVTCICGTPGIGQYEGPQRDCPVHGEQQDGGES